MLPFARSVECFRSVQLHTGIALGLHPLVQLGRKLRLDFGVLGILYDVLEFKRIAGGMVKLFGRAFHVAFHQSFRHR